MKRSPDTTAAFVMAALNRKTSLRRSATATLLLAPALLLRECGADEPGSSGGCDPFCTQWTCANSAHCGSCGVCQAVATGQLNEDYCKSEVYGDRNSIFYELWSPNWERFEAGGHSCWDDEPGGAAGFFSDVFEGKGATCQANWFTSAGGNLAGPDARPRFTGEAKAVLGLDPAIFEYCSDATGKPHWYKGNDMIKRPHSFLPLRRRLVNLNGSVFRHQLVSLRVNT